MWYKAISTGYKGNNAMECSPFVLLPAQELGKQEDTRARQLSNHKDIQSYQSFKCFSTAVPRTSDTLKHTGGLLHVVMICKQRKQLQAGLMWLLCGNTGVCRSQQREVNDLRVRILSHYDVTKCKQFFVPTLRALVPYSPKHLCTIVVKQRLKHITNSACMNCDAIPVCELNCHPILVYTSPTHSLH